MAPSMVMKPFATFLHCAPKWQDVHFTSREENVCPFANTGQFLLF